MESDSGFILLPRTLENWGWTDEPYTFYLFVKIVYRANWETREWRDEVVERGSFITSVSKLADEVGLSIQQTRTALANIQKGKLITIKATNKYTKITVLNYDNYQLKKKACQQADNEQSNEQVTSEQQATNNKRINRLIDKDIKDEEKTSTIVDVKKPKTTRFCPPTVPEVRAYADSIWYTSLDAEGFIDYYTQSGWIMGNGRKVKDWKACVRTWRKRDEKSGIATSRPAASTGKDLRDLKDGKPHRADELSEEGLLALRMENFELWREVKRGASFKWAEVSNIFSSIPKMEWVRV